MSVVAAWDLKVPPAQPTASSQSSAMSSIISPRAICVMNPMDVAVGTPTGGHFTSKNPFDAAAPSTSKSSSSDSSSSSATVGIVYGTDAGSLHYRAYTSPNYPSTRGGGGGASWTGATGGGKTSSSSTDLHTKDPVSSTSLQIPLGVAGPSTRPSPQLPRWFYPIDHQLLLHKSGSSSSKTVIPPSSPVVSCLNLRVDHPKSSSSSNKVSQFLLLLDDNRASIGATSGGSSSTAAGGTAAAGAYASQIVSLSVNGFQQLQASAANSLPRMSCAVVLSDGGTIVYASGRTIGTLSLEPNAATADHKQHPKHLQPPQLLRRKTATLPTGSNVASSYVVTSSVVALPAPGVRSGPHALAVTTSSSSMQVAVVAVGNAFYAVNLSATADYAAHTTPSNSSSHHNHHNYHHHSVEANASFMTTATTTKIVSLTQSYSQVHPVIVLDLNDSTVDPDWTSVLIANGRECAVVDLFVPPTDLAMLVDNSGPAASSTPGGNIVSGPSSAASSLLAPLARIRGSSLITVNSPILAAASAPATGNHSPPSPPWVVVLTSDGLVSIRSPSCLAIVLRQIEVGRSNDYFELMCLLHSTTAPAATPFQTQQQQLSVPPTTLSSTKSTSALTSGSSALTSMVLAASYSGEGKVIGCPPDSQQDLADRMMRLSIDAFGVNGFPRTEVAEALNSSFAASSASAAATTSSYVGTTTEVVSPLGRSLLQQYLEALLGLCDWESGATSGWPTEPPTSSGGGLLVHHHGTFGRDELSPSPATTMAAADKLSGRGGKAQSVFVSAMSPSTILTGSALLCMVCMQVTPPHSSLANRTAKLCCEKVGVVVLPTDTSEGPEATTTGNIGSTPAWKAATRVCELVVDKLLREAPSLVSLLSGSSPAPILARGHRTSQAVLYTEFVECCVWLLRSCGNHERALEVAYERLQRQQHPSNAAGPDANQTAPASASSSSARGAWSQYKYEAYTTSHLSDLWGQGSDAACQLVFQSTATHRLLENNPKLGLSVFCSSHPQNDAQWRATRARDDPLANPERVQKVLKLLKSIQPCLVYSTNSAFTPDLSLSSDKQALPLTSGRALAVCFLESAVGISTRRPAEAEEFDSLPPDQHIEERIADFHDELSLLLLEGVIAERRPDEPSDEDTELGSIYRSHLRQLLRWPLAKIRADRFTSALPPSFLQEKALILGRLGRHEDALRILYRDLNDLDLALEYCDARHEQLKDQQDRDRARQQHQGMFEDFQMFDSGSEDDNAYLPLVRVALDSEDTERGTAAAIQVLALRRSSIDRAAALRLLPPDVPVSAVARPFLIPALVDSESQVRRLMVVSSLLRARYLRLKDQLTSAQLKAQANLHVVPQLRSLNLGDPLHSTNPFRARTSSSAGSAMPDVMIVKHFFPRHLVIQAKVTNSVGLHAKFARTLSDISFVVAESSEEAIQPLLQVPIQVLPPKMTGSAWCVLSASPSRMDGPTAQLTCELRYTVQSVELSSGSASVPAALLMSPGGGGPAGRTYVEELQDLEVHSSHFS